MKGIQLVSSDGFKIQSSDGYYIHLSMESIAENVDKIPQIPVDAKRAVKDFIIDNFTELCDMLPDFDSLNLSIELLERLPNFIEYLELAFSF